MGEQQLHLSTQLKELISITAAVEKNKKVDELDKSYTDMETRLSRLEGRLEILIDGFTALAQEMNKMKRSRQTSRTLQEKRALPALTTVLAPPAYSTFQTPVRIIPTTTPLTSRATVPKSIPTPGLPTNRSTSGPRRGRNHKPTATITSRIKSTTRSQRVTSKKRVSTRSPIKKTTLSKPRTTLKSTTQTTAKPQTKKPDSRRPVTAKRVVQSSKSKPRQVKKEATTTKFQLEPPSHKPPPAKPAKPVQKKEPLKNSRRNNSVRSDAPVPKKVPESRGSSEGRSKKSSTPHKGNSNKNEKKVDHNSQKIKTSAKRTVTTPKPNKTTTVKKTPTTVTKKPTPPKTKATTAKKVTKKTQQKKRVDSNSGVVNLLQLLSGGPRSKPKKNQEGSLHVILGKLAIPIKIIPDE